MQRTAVPLSIRPMRRIRQTTPTKQTGANQHTNPNQQTPRSGRMHRERDPGLWYRTRALDLKYVGVPGIVNFVDARTQWIDDAFERALDDGIKQVGACMYVCDVLLDCALRVLPGWGGWMHAVLRSRPPSYTQAETHAPSSAPFPPPSPPLPLKPLPSSPGRRHRRRLRHARVPPRALWCEVLRGRPAAREREEARARGEAVPGGRGEDRM